MLNIYKKKLIKPIRSPLFYVGDKYKLMPQLINLFPDNINNFYDVFCGGGSTSLNTQAKTFHMNDININVIQLHKLLQINSINMEKFITQTQNIINEYGLSISEKGINSEIENLKKLNKKTYFAIYNKSNYLKLRETYNKTKQGELLYILLIYGFNHMVRFNKKGEFNLPVGNVDWNKNVTQALLNYSNWYLNNKVYLSHGIDFQKYVNTQNFKKNDFLYFDPPYLITFSDYNKLWTKSDEQRLLDTLDNLNKQNIKWGFSNMLSHKGKTNTILFNWMNKYDIYKIESNYISYFNNKSKPDSQEIYITNLNKKL